MFVFHQCCKNSPFSTQQQSSHWHLSTGNISITQHSNHGHTIDITKPHSRAHYRYHKAQPREIYRYHKSRLPDNLSISQSPASGQSIDITKPYSRAVYRYHKARITGTLSISQSPIQWAIYRQHQPPITGTLSIWKSPNQGIPSISQSPTQGHSLDITIPKSKAICR